MDRRRFTLAALFPASFLVGCNSGQIPSREATLVHNQDVRQAVADLDQATNALEMHLQAVTAENWQDTLANAETSVVRLRADIDGLKKALGYGDTA